MYSTYDYMASETTPKPFSIRMSAGTLERLGQDAQRRGEAKARIAERLIDEGLRMADHPGILFRDGPAGRRAALASGPDVWEVIGTLKEMGAGDEQAIAATAEWGNLLPAQVDTAVRYYADFREEVDERIARNREEAARQHAAWKRVQAALA